jgi:hypothetical protein
MVLLCCLSDVLNGPADDGGCYSSRNERWSQLGRLERSSEVLLSFVDGLRDCSVALGPIFTVVV